jgi:hypothetical protein
VGRSQNCRSIMQFGWIGGRRTVGVHAITSAGKSGKGWHCKPSWLKAA